MISNHFYNRNCVSFLWLIICRSGTSSKQIDALWERYRIVQENANLSLRMCLSSLFKLFRSVVKFGCEEEAFLLAEDFEEFETLVQLTLANKSKDHRIKSYISRFGKPFAVVLYQALLDKSIIYVVWLITNRIVTRVTCP